jgi:hypothetical protein
MYTVLSSSPPTVSGQNAQISYVGFDVPAVAVGSTRSFFLGLTVSDSFNNAHATFQIQAWKEGK